MTDATGRTSGSDEGAGPDDGTGRNDGTGPGERARPGAGTGADEGIEPDARFTYANERTFLAWNRTALALILGGLAIVQLLPPFPGVPWGRRMLAVPLIILGALLAVVGYLDWGRNQQAMRHGQPLPNSPLPRILAVSIAALAVVAAVLVLLSAALK